VAVSPDTDGLAKAAGQDVVMVVGPWDCAVIGPLPPPDRMIRSGTAVGTNEPSAWARSVGSTGTHEPLRSTRAGVVVIVVVNVPSGLALVVEVCDVSASTVIASPDLAAAALAADSFAGVDESATAVAGPSTLDGADAVVEVLSEGGAEAVVVGSAAMARLAGDGAAFGGCDEAVGLVVGEASAPLSA